MKWFWLLLGVLFVVVCEWCANVNYEFYVRHTGNPHGLTRSEYNICSKDFPID